MAIVGEVLAILLRLFWFVLLARLVLDLVQAFARQWRPQGFMLVLAEAVYTITDPPIRAVRRVVPPLRLGSIQFDLAFLIVLIVVQILTSLALVLTRA